MRATNGWREEIVNRYDVVRRVLKSGLIATAVAVLASACHPGAGAKASSPPAAPDRVANLHAFARLYGVVRWFHPSDAAAAADWERCAIDGARRVVDAPSPAALRTALLEVFRPVAPTVQVAIASETFSDEPALHPPDAAHLDLIAWQHKGYGDSTVASGYVSKRRHRDRQVQVPGVLFAARSQSVDATPYRGKRIRLRGKVRTANHGKARLWLRVDAPSATTFFDNMWNRPGTSASWVLEEITGTVAPEASKVVFGALLFPPGTAWFDDFELAYESEDGGWHSIPILDGGFENADLSNWPAGTGRSPAPTAIEGWSIAIDPENPASGSASLRISQLTEALSQDLFEPTPKPGEVADVDLGSGLRARIPIALYSRDGHTLGDDVAVAQRLATQRQRPPERSFDTFAAVADVVIFWNVFQHFWPYWSSVATDWNAALDAALGATLVDRVPDDHLRTLQRLSTQAPDGHVSIACPGVAEDAFLPFAMALVENQVVVTTSRSDQVKRGDVVLSIDGRSAPELLANEASLQSGSPQWRNVQALALLGRGAPGSSFAVRIRQAGIELEQRLSRVEYPVRADSSHTPIWQSSDGVYYVDLSRAAAADIDKVMTDLATAPGVVFDVRRYPRSHDVLSHIPSHVVVPKGWELIPWLIRPNTAADPVHWEDTSTWNMPVLSAQQPFLTGRVAFLTGPGAISYAESVMALARYLHLGEIFGAATAGTNGDVAAIELPTGCSTLFTGRRVTHPDGTQHHLVGIAPTVPVSPTIAGVTAGRDEVLERALDYVRTGRK